MIGETDPQITQIAQMKKRKKMRNRERTASHPSSFFSSLLFSVSSVSSVDPSVSSSPKGA